MQSQPDRSNHAQTPEYQFSPQALLHANDVVMKILSNVLVIILNYVISKLMVFRKR